MHDLILFVAGTIFIVLLLPIVQSLSDIICGFSQWIVSIINVHVITNNTKIQDMQEPINTQAIGFQPPEPEYYDEDDEEPEEKFKVGFRS